MQVLSLGGGLGKDEFCQVEQELTHLVFDRRKDLAPDVVTALIAASQPSDVIADSALEKQ